VEAYKRLPLLGVEGSILGAIVAELLGRGATPAEVARALGELAHGIAQMMTLPEVAEFNAAGIALVDAARREF
jgi:hypothetical protein